MRQTHDEYYLQMLTAVAARSTCGRRMVGTILTDRHHQILSTGYNGVPRNYAHCDVSPCLGRYDPPGDSRRCAAVHAEVNAVLQCHRIDLIHTAYVSTSPCFTCAKMLCNTNVRRIVCREAYADTLGLELLKAQGIIFIVANDLNLDTIEATS